MFSFPIRVYWEDTDAGGVVYHASYLRFLERARTEWLRAQGVDQSQLKEQHGIVLVVRSMSLDFLKPALLDDALQASVRLSKRAGASLLIDQELMRGDLCLLRASAKIACLDAAAFSPRPLPDWLAKV
jgi:acyl-CoA thioester hydrolase